MRLKTKRQLTIVLVVICSLLLGVFTDIAWGWINKVKYPQKYEESVKKYSVEYDVPEYIIYSIIKVESNFRPSAKSKAGAVGLMQIMPQTFEWLTSDKHFGEHLEYEKLEDPDISIKYGTYYFRYLLNKFDSIETALAAYNAGEGVVSEWLKDQRYSDDSGSLTDIPYPETENYLIKANKAIEHYKNLYYKDKEI